MSDVLLLGVVKPDYWKDDRELFKRVKEELRFKNWIYFSESEKHTLVFFISGNKGSMAGYMDKAREIYNKVAGLKKDFKFSFDLDIFIGGVKVV